MEVEICRIHPSARLPEYKTEGAACFDLEAIEETIIGSQDIVLLPTGLVVKTPPGYFLCIAPRSSNPKYGLDMPHSFGILDPDYRGVNDEIKILLKNITSKPVIIEKYQRVAQATFLPAPRITWKEINKSALGKSRGGYGSTGC